MASFFDRITGEKQRASITSNGLTLEFDASISETHIGNAVTSEHPVEGGADMTDHIQRVAEELQIVGMVTDTPIVLLASLRAEPSVEGGDPQSRAQDAYGFLRGIKDAGQLCQVSTTLREYDNMAIVGSSVTRDKDTGRVLEIALSLKEILIANTEQVAAPEPTSDSRASKTQQGKKQKTPAPPPVASESQTLLEQGANFVAGIVG